MAFKYFIPHVKGALYAILNLFVEQFESTQAFIQIHYYIYVFMYTYEYMYGCMYVSGFWKNYVSNQLHIIHQIFIYPIVCSC